jgi:hypothetical protein
MIKQSKAIAISSVLALAACASPGPGPVSGWTSLVDNGNGMENFNHFRDANWRVVDGAIQADTGGKDPAYLVSKRSYKDFELRAEFWASDDANSGVFLRCQNVQDVGDENCFEVNIFDQRPDPTYATGAIVKVSPVPASFERAGGKWNTFEITAKGQHLVVVMNGKKTADVMATRNHLEGPIALQWGRGTIKFRKVQIREL